MSHPRQPTSSPQPEHPPEISHGFCLGAVLAVLLSLPVWFGLFMLLQ